MESELKEDKVEVTQFFRKHSISYMFAFLLFLLPPYMILLETYKY